jgi:oleate hydratase
MVGGGIASMAAAAFLIRDAGVPDRNIHILETLDVAGGSLDGANTAYSASISKSLRSTTDSTTPRSA